MDIKKHKKRNFFDSINTSGFHTNINKFKNDKKFMELVEDLIINYPAIEKSGYQALMKNKQKEILLLNNICLSTLQSSYMGLISHWLKL